MIILQQRVVLIVMTEGKRSVEDMKVEFEERDRKLNKKDSNENPDKVDDNNRRIEWRRSKYERLNYDESRDQDDDEYKARRTI